MPPSRPSLPHPPLTSRRHFLRQSAVALAAPFFARSVRAQAPSRVLRHASFGAFGMAWGDIQAITSNPFVKLVAVADVDLSRTAAVRERFPDVRVYQDWRQLLDREGRELDSVNVATPDHMHAQIALAAMQLGKHVYCQKPLTHSIHETRVLTRRAAESKLVTQMGIQIHSQKVYRQAVAIVQSGVIGKVREVHAWSNKKWGARGAPPEKADPIPASLDWDLWLGGCTARPYVGQHYHPKNWRRRLEFGTGTFGDMGCHIFDPVFEALELTAPLSLRSEGPAPDAWNWSTDARIKYVFPGTRFTAGLTVDVHWYDGAAPKPREIMDLVGGGAPKAAEIVDDEAPIDGRKRPVRNIFGEGSIVIGTDGVLHIPHIFTPKLFPVSKFAGYKLPAVEGTHHWSDWAEACVGLSGRPLAPFSYSGPLTEAVLLGSVAVRYPQTTLNWDAAAMAFTNETEANQHLRRTYRPGWGLAGV